MHGSPGFFDAVGDVFGLSGDVQGRSGVECDDIVRDAGFGGQRGIEHGLGLAGIFHAQVAGRCHGQIEVFGMDVLKIRVGFRNVWGIAEVIAFFDLQFQKIAEAEQPFLTLLGKQAIDEDNGQTAQMLAALLDRPQATSCSKVDIADGKATVTREVDSGLETLEVDLPAVLSVDLRLNEPRYVKLPDIMKAKKKPLDIKSVADYGVAEGAAFKTVKVDPPPSRQKGIIVKDVAELVGVLKQKGLV